MKDKDDIDIQHVYELLDLVIEYRADCVKLVCGREDVEDNLQKAECAQEIIDKAIAELIPEGLQGEVSERLRNKSEALYESITFVPKGANQ